VPDAAEAWIKLLPPADTDQALFGSKQINALPEAQVV